MLPPAPSTCIKDKCRYVLKILHCTKHLLPQQVDPVEVSHDGVVAEVGPGEHPGARPRDAKQLPLVRVAEPRAGGQVPRRALVKPVLELEG